jgi:hypothetical protein
METQLKTLSIIDVDGEELSRREMIQSLEKRIEELNTRLESLSSRIESDTVKLVNVSDCLDRFELLLTRRVNLLEEQIIKNMTPVENSGWQTVQPRNNSNYRRRGNGNMNYRNNNGNHGNNQYRSHYSNQSRDTAEAYGRTEVE